MVGRHFTLKTFLAVLAGLCAKPLPAVAVDTDWVEGFNSRTRLSAGMVTENGEEKLFAFVEVSMPEGWKTYWRNPGDAGGLPPAFSWTRSENVERAEALFPAPKRLTDTAGDNIGYKELAVFPIAITRQDPGKATRLALDLQFGICKDICVPSEAALEIEIPPGNAAGKASAEAAEQLSRVPRKADRRLPQDPILESAQLDEASGKPKLVITAKFPGGSAGADIFIEAPDGLYVPMVSRTSKDDGEVQVFEAELGSGLEPKDIRGKTLVATMVSAKGQSEAAFSLE
jgi:DsbC/DsbD-like thiol-disulfide interchange protein